MFRSPSVGTFLTKLKLKWRGHRLAWFSQMADKGVRRSTCQRYMDVPRVGEFPFSEGNKEGSRSPPDDPASRASLGFSLALSDSLPPKLHVPTLDEIGTGTWGDSSVGGQGTSS